MTIVFGNTIEPGGMELDDDSHQADCPECGSADAEQHFWEECDGGCINQYHRLTCHACGKSSGNYDQSPYYEDESCDDDFPNQSDYDMGFTLYELMDFAIERLNHSIENLAGAAIRDLKFQSYCAKESILRM